MGRRDWKGKAVQCCCDNATVVAILKSGTSRHPLVMHLMRCLFSYHQLFPDPVHPPGRLIEAADSLSCDNLPHFLQLVPTALAVPPNPSSGRADGGSGTQNTRLDIRRLDNRAAHYFAQGIASSTFWTYQSGHDQFLKFYQLSGTEPLPASEAVLGGIWRMQD